VTREVEELSRTIRKLQGKLGLLVGIEEIVRRNIHLTFAHKVRTSMAGREGCPCIPRPSVEADARDRLQMNRLRQGKVRLYPTVTGEADRVTAVRSKPGAPDKSKK